MNKFENELLDMVYDASYERKEDNMEWNTSKGKMLISIKPID